MCFLGEWNHSMERCMLVVSLTFLFWVSGRQPMHAALPRMLEQGSKHLGPWEATAASRIFILISALTFCATLAPISPLQLNCSFHPPWAPFPYHPWWASSCLGLTVFKRSMVGSFSHYCFRGRWYLYLPHPGAHVRPSAHEGHTVFTNILLEGRASALSH